MFRRIAAALMAVAVIAAAAPWLFGLQTKQVYDGARDDLAARGYRIIDEHYRLGWLSSEAELVIGAPGLAPGSPAEAAPPLADPDQPRLRVVTRIAHGPLIRSGNARTIGLAVLRSRLTVVGGVRRLPPLLLEGAIGLDRSLALNARMPAISYAGRDRQLRLSGLSADIALAGPSAAMRIDGRLDLLVLGAADGTAVSIDGLRWRLRLEPVRDLLPLPVGEIAFDHVWLRGVGIGDQALEAEQVDIDVALGQDAERLDVSASVDAAGLSWQGVRVGPARIGAALSGIDLEAARALRDALDVLRAQPMAPSVRGMMQVRLLQTELPTLFDEDARLLLDPVELAGRQGSISARLGLGLRPAASASTPWPDRLAGEARIGLPQPLLLDLLARQQLERISAELRRRGEPTELLPPELADQVADVAQSALAGLIHERWLVPRRGRLQADLGLDDGVLTINGRRLPLASAVD